MSRFLFTIVAALLTLSSCTMIMDNQDDCPRGLYVRFVYDYNTQRADMFKDHVGHVTLFVFDENGNKVAERSVSNTSSSAPLAEYGYAIHFAPDELPAGRYRLQAVALQRDWDEALDAPGAKYRRTADVNHHEALNIKLDYTDELLAESNHHHVAHNYMPLDTLWHTLKVMSFPPQDGVTPRPLQRTQAPYSVYPLQEQMVEVKDNMVTYATVSLIRDTKHINITLHQLDDRANIFHQDYDVKILDTNALLLHDNAVAPGDSLRYTPFAHWTSRTYASGTVEMETAASLAAARATESDDDPVTERTAHFNLMTNRIMHNAKDKADNAVLSIVNRNTGLEVARINLPSFLSEARHIYSQYNYSSQEFLDREHDYHLNMFLRGDTWDHCSIIINTLSWNVRNTNVNL